MKEPPAHSLRQGADRDARWAHRYRDVRGIDQGRPTDQGRQRCCGPEVGAADYPCAILDENVARALHDTCGWKSLPIKGGWHPNAYERYCTRLGMWVDKHEGITRRDMIERWLFEEGKRLAEQ